MGWSNRQAMLESGASAPDFDLPALDGTSRSLKQMLAAGPAVLAFFKNSCPVCQYTFPFLERLHAGGRGLQLIGISQDKPDGARAFSREYGLTFPVLLDDPKSYPVSNAFGIHTVPTLFVVEQDGRISAASYGFSKKDLEAIGARMGVSPFHGGERVPEFRPG